jgi:hypothetical protein
MFHYLYKTTCLVTDKWYIGVHSTCNLYDGYLGSGTLLQRSVEKYGVDNHDRVWLEFFDTREEAFARESDIVTEEFIASNPQCMNLKPGGSGGWTNEENMWKATYSGLATQKWLRENDPEWLEKLSKSFSDALINSYEIGSRMATGWPKDPKNWTEEATKKRAKTRAEICFNQKENNSQWGTKWAWVSNEDSTRKIPLEELNIYLSQGYVRGRKFKI